MFTIKEIEEAGKSLGDFVIKTPLIRAYALEKLLKVDYKIFLKCENLQVTGSFKARGAFFALNKLKQNGNGVVTRSSGNFGIAVSLGAKRLNIPCQIVLSSAISEFKRKQIEDSGALIHFRTTRQEEDLLVQEISERTGAVWLSPFEHKDVIMGAASLGLEVYNQLLSIKHFIGPIGGGGLMGGSSLAFKLLDQNIETIGVEPEGANDYFLSRKEEKKVKLQRVDTICDGLRAPEVGQMAFSLLGKFLDKVEVVSDKEVIEAVCLLYKEMGIVLEPSGAISAALLLRRPVFTGDVVCVLSGGNINSDQFLKGIGNERN